MLSSSRASSSFMWTFCLDKDRHRNIRTDNVTCSSLVSWLIVKSRNTLINTQNDINKLCISALLSNSINKLENLKYAKVNLTSIYKLHINIFAILKQKLNSSQNYFTASLLWRNFKIQNTSKIFLVSQYQINKIFLIKEIKDFKMFYLYD
jgi:hypothetical protein